MDHGFLDISGLDPGCRHFCMLASVGESVSLYVELVACCIETTTRLLSSALGDISG